MLPSPCQPCTAHHLELFQPWTRFSYKTIEAESGEEMDETEYVDVEGGVQVRSLAAMNSYMLSIESC